MKNQEAKTACMLPKHARYQLRHTPKEDLLSGDPGHRAGKGEAEIRNCCRNISIIAKRWSFVKLSGAKRMETGEIFCKGV